MNADKKPLEALSAWMGPNIRFEMAIVEPQAGAGR